MSPDACKIKSGIYFKTEHLMQIPDSKHGSIRSHSCASKTPYNPVEIRV